MGMQWWASRTVGFFLKSTRERFSYDLEMKTGEQNAPTEIERFDWVIERIQTRVAFG